MALVLRFIPVLRRRPERCVVDGLLSPQSSGLRRSTDGLGCGFGHFLNARILRLDLFLDFLGNRRFIPVGLDHHQRRADRDLIADFAREFDHHARHRRFHLDRRLVGHHVGDLLILLDALADMHMPCDDLGLGDAFADIRQAESEASHASQSFRSFLSASPMRTGPGK